MIIFFLNEWKGFFSSNYLNTICKNNDDYYMYETQFNWNNNINSYLHSQICINNVILGDIDNTMRVIIFWKDKNCSAERGKMVTWSWTVSISGLFFSFERPITLMGPIQNCKHFIPILTFEPSWLAKFKEVRAFPPFLFFLARLHWF